MSSQRTNGQHSAKPKQKAQKKQQAPIQNIRAADDELTLETIIDERPPIKVVRHFIREQARAITEREDEAF